jgi:DNA-binding response OmpR family regulator
MRLLLIEDDHKAARLLAKGRREEGWIVDLATTGEAGEDFATANAYDAIVLDWMLPDKDGLRVCRDLRARRIATPILMLTARRGLDDRVAGLNTGADDYITKPFEFAELLARLSAVLRRSALTRPAVLEVADLTLDPATHRVARGGAAISLTPKEYAILEVLMRHAGTIVSRGQLGEHAWDNEPDGFTNAVDVHVSHLRRKIDRNRAPALIRTIRGYGYRLGVHDDP